MFDNHLLNIGDKVEHVLIGRKSIVDWVEIIFNYSSRLILYLCHYALHVCRVKKVCWISPILIALSIIFFAFDTRETIL